MSKTHILNNLTHDQITSLLEKHDLLDTNISATKFNRPRLASQRNVKDLSIELCEWYNRNSENNGHLPITIEDLGNNTIQLKEKNGSSLLQSPVSHESSSTHSGDHNNSLQRSRQFTPVDNLAANIAMSVRSNIQKEANLLPLTTSRTPEALELLVSQVDHFRQAFDWNDAEIISALFIRVHSTLLKEAKITKHQNQTWEDARSALLNCFGETQRDVQMRIQEYARRNDESPINAFARFLQILDHSRSNFDDLPEVNKHFLLGEAARKTLPTSAHHDLFYMLWQQADDQTDVTKVFALIKEVMRHKPWKPTYAALYNTEGGTADECNFVNNRVCFNCGRPGHQQKDCPRENKFDSMQKQIDNLQKKTDERFSSFESTFNTLQNAMGQNSNEMRDMMQQLVNMNMHNQPRNDTAPKYTPRFGSSNDKDWRKPSVPPRQARGQPPHSECPKCARNGKRNQMHWSSECPLTK